MNDPKIEGLKTTLRMITLAVLGFVLDAVIEKLTRSNLPIKEVLIPALIWLDRVIFVKNKELRTAKFDLPWWSKLKIPF